jgi:hypothetical protein
LPRDAEAVITFDDAAALSFASRGTREACAIIDAVCAE